MLQRLLFIALLLTGSTLPAQDTGKKYALLIGVETYDPAVLRPLDFSEDDVLALGQSFERLGFTSIVMTSQNAIPARKPSTAKKINDQIDGLLKLIKSDKDTLVVVLSGHGLQYKNDPVDADNSKESYFCPEEANPKDRASLVSITALSKKVSLSTAGKKLLVVDACRNEVAAKGNKALEEELDPVGRRARTEQAGMYALFSCAPKEKSWEHPDLKHGVFTSQLIKYLDGQADSSLYPRQQISIQQLAAYASRETTEFVYKRLNQEQTPELLGKGTDWSLGRRDGGLKEITSQSTGMKFALIPAGEFKMGSSAADVQAALKADPNLKEEYLTSEQPQHSVKITQPFYMGVYEVTQGEFQKVLGRNTSYFSPNGGGKEKVSGLTTSRFPVESVTWFDAIEFCNKLSEADGRTPYYRLTSIERNTDQSIKTATVSFNPNANGVGAHADGVAVKQTGVGATGYRLPTEAEWEYACRANTNTPFHFGSVLNGDKANVDGNYPFGTTTKGAYLERTTAVDDSKYPKNAFGLAQMHGNVYEWCEDMYDEKAYASRSGVTTNPLVTSGSEYRVLRGGSWVVSSRYSRSADRDWFTPGFRNEFFGFRVVLSALAVRTP